MACLAIMPLGGSINAFDLKFKVVAIEPLSRIDAIAHLGNGIVIAGTRGSHPGYIYKSEDYGASWRKVGNITDSEQITCLCSGDNGVAICSQVIRYTFGELQTMERHGRTWAGFLLHHTKVTLMPMAC